MVAGPQERPSGNARPAAARRSSLGGVPGQPVPAAGLSELGRGSHAGGAGWGGGTAHSCCCPCPRGAAVAGVPTRWSSRLRLAAPVGERRAGFRGCCTRYRGSAYRVEEQQPTTTPPPCQRGGCRGGRSLLPYAWSGVAKREGVPTGHSLLLLSKQTGRWSVRSGAVPRPHWVKSYISDTCSTVGRQHRGFAPVPLFTAGHSLPRHPLQIYPTYRVGRQAHLAVLLP